LHAAGVPVAGGTESCHQDHRPEPVRHPFSKIHNLRHREQRPLIGCLAAGARDSARVAPDQLVMVDRCIADRRKQTVCLGHHRDGYALVQQRLQSTRRGCRQRYDSDPPSSTPRVRQPRHLKARVHEKVTHGEDLVIVQGIRRWPFSLMSTRWPNPNHSFRASSRRPCGNAVGHEGSLR